MKSNLLLIIAFTVLLISCDSKKHEIVNTNDNTRLQPFEFENSAFLDNKTYSVYLPASYEDSTTKRYPVLFMMDNQNLFINENSYSGHAWNIDKVADSLAAIGQIRECIIVGINHASEKRFLEYMPQKPVESLSEDGKKQIDQSNVSVYSDRFLQFLVKELKPHIDIKFRTLTDQSNTFVGGSSMGGLISMYAQSEYPTIFGGAICMSTHWSITMDDAELKIANNLMNYFYNALSSDSYQNSGKHKWYFDYGTKGLDQHYGKWQTQVDELLKIKVDENNWLSKKYEGHDHNEKSWNERLHVPLTFMLSEEGVEVMRDEVLR